MNVVIIGAQASGKMTVGQELEKLAHLTLFHNHKTIDFVLSFIPDYEMAKQLINQFRMDTFHYFAKHADKLGGLIFTVVIDFDDASDIQFLEELQTIFNEDVYFVELETTLDERLKRNETENRLLHKPLKRNIEWSKQDILETAKTHRFNSDEPLEQLHHYLKINNTQLLAETVAQHIMTWIRGESNETVNSNQ